MEAQLGQTRTQLANEQACMLCLACVLCLAMCTVIACEFQSSHWGFVSRADFLPGSSH